MNLPGFLSLQSAWWLLLAIPVVVFYFLKLRRPQRQISSLVLWQQVINDQRVNSPLQRFKRNLLLLFQLLLLAALILAAMQPFWQRQAERAEYLPVLIDCSASMAARDSIANKTRLEIAKRQVESLIDDLLGDQRMAIIAVSSTAQRMSGFTNNKRVLRQALEDVTIHDVRSSLEDALRMTQAMSRSVPIQQVMLFTDGNVPEQIEFDLPFEINYQRVGQPESNLGITAFNARRAGADRWQVFVRVEGTASTNSGGTVSLYRANSLDAEDYVRGESGRAAKLVFAVDADRPVDLTLKLTPDGADAVDSDNIAFLHLPQPRSLRVYCPPTLTTFRRALDTMSGLEIHPRSEDQDLPSQFDLWIDRSEPADDRNVAVRLMVDHVPAPLSSKLRFEEDVGEIIDWDRTEPLLRHVQLQDVVTMKQSAYVGDTKENDLEEMGFEVLIHGQRGPWMLRESGGSHMTYHFLVDPSLSTLVYRVAFPVFVTNLINVAEREASLSEVRADQTGILSVRDLEPNSEYQVKSPNGSKQDVASSEDGQLIGVAAPIVGRYVIQGASEPPQEAGAALLDAQETQLVSREALQFREARVTVATETVTNDRPLWWAFAWIGLAFLLLEWWFFNRRHALAGETPKQDFALADGPRAATWK